MLSRVFLRGSSLARSTTSGSYGSVAVSVRHHGGLADEDRIFTNLYGERDFRLKDAMKRVRR